MSQTMLVVTGKDQPGIIARVSEILFRHQCNLEDISMTLLEGEFSMMLIFSLRNSRKRAALEEEIRQLERRWRLGAYWKPISRPLRRGEKHAKGARSYILSAIGRDRMGIVYETSRLLARSKLNITDLNSRILGKGRRAVYAMILEVDVPLNFSIPKLVRALQQLRRKLRIEIHLKPVEALEL